LDPYDALLASVSIASVRRTLDDLAKFLGVAQGAYFVVINLGIGIAVVGAVTGALALAADMPWWSVALIGSGTFFATTGALGFLGSWIAGKRASPLTPAIEAGLKLRERLLEVADDSDEERHRWEARYSGWVADSAEVIDRVAPHRVTAFLTDYLWTDDPRLRALHKKPPEGQPKWAADLVAEIDNRLDRLLMMRVSI
jgi:hypothetical protein